MSKIEELLKEIDEMQFPFQLQNGRTITTISMEQTTKIIDNVKQALTLLAKQPTDAPTLSPEAERPSTHPNLPPVAKTSEFTKKAGEEVIMWKGRQPSRTTTTGYDIGDRLKEACGLLDCLEKEAKTTLGTNVRLKAEYNKLQAQLTERGRLITNISEANEDFRLQIIRLEAKIDRLEAKVKHTVDYCKVQVGVSCMSISAAMGITGLSYSEVKVWLEIDIDDCETYTEAIAKAKRIVKEQG